MIQRTLKQIRPYASRLGRSLGTLTLVGLLSGIVEAAALTLTVHVVLEVATGGDNEELEIVGLALSPTAALVLACLSALLSAGLHWVAARQSAQLTARVMYETRRATIQGFLAASWPSQAVEREGALQEAATTLASRVAATSQSLAVGATQITTLMVLAVVAACVDPALTAGVVAGGVLAQLLLRPLARRTRSRSTEFVAANSLYAEEVSKLTSSAMELRSFGVAEIAADRLDEVGQNVRQRHEISRTATLYGSAVFKDVALLLLIGFSAVAFATIDGSFLDAGIVLALLVRAIASAQQVNAAFQQLSEHSPALDALNAQLGRLSAEPEPTGSDDCGQIYEIVMKGVGYTYPNGHQALSDVNLEIHRGDVIGVVGPSGAGKSTLVEVLLRLRAPTMGQVTINGEPYERLSTAALTREIGFVPQEPALLEASISDNIAFFRPANFEALRDAAQIASIDEEISRLAAGYDTQLGPRGIGLSGGQKQRLAIARAFLGDPSVLVLDEPSSALDPVSEELLETAIRNASTRAAVIVIAHRPSTLRACTRFLAVERGTVRETNSYDTAVSYARASADEAAKLVDGD